jgi:hypothetical protein
MFKTCRGSAHPLFELYLLLLLLLLFYSGIMLFLDCVQQIIYIFLKDYNIFNYIFIWSLYTYLIYIHTYIYNCLVFILICLIFLYIISTEGLTGLGLCKPDLPATHLRHPTKS